MSAGAAVPERVVSRLMAEPLVAVGARRAESEALKIALAAYDRGGDPLERAFLDRYLNEHPASPWKPAILGNLGLAEVHAGRFTQALADFKAAWQAGKDIPHPQVRAFVDRVAGERLTLHARLGHQQALEASLAELQGRTLVGPASEARADALEGLWQMRNAPRTAFLCGPLALEQLLFQRDPSFPPNIATTLPPQAGGYSLDKLAALAADKGLDLKPIRRQPGQPVPVQAIVHWKSGHYAALVAEQDGRFEIRDAALGRNYWVSRQTLEEEGSGYYLAPTRQLAKAGWQPASAVEAAGVVGAGYTGAFSNTSTQICSNACGCDGSSKPPFTPAPPMLQAAAQSMLVSLSLTDTPIVYTPAKGPAVPLTLAYSQREAYQPATFHYFNFGPKWSYTGLSYVVDDPRGGGNGVQRFEAGGGTALYGGYNATTGEFTRDAKDLSLLVRVSSSPIAYERRLSGGGKEVFRQSDGKAAYPRRIFLSEIVDAAGNALRFDYDSQLRLTTITDADGRATTFQYGDADPLRVTGITDPFRRQATITYDGAGRLTSITDVIGISSSVTYAGASNFVDSLTTPYGTSRYAYGENGTTRWLELTDPNGETERVEFNHGAPGIPFSESQVPAGISAFNAYINGRNSFYWDKTAHKLARGDYTKARVKHWFHDRNNSSVVTGVLESIKNPLESRIWYNYPGQGRAGANGTCDKPAAIGRVLPDGSTQLTRMAYNVQGNLTRRIDPKGRETLYEYAANGIDLLRVKQKTASGYDLLAEFTWNAQHRPLTVKDAAGQVATLTYNDAGQILSRTDPLGRTWRYEYSAEGRLARVINPNGALQASYTHDALGRIATETDSEGYLLAHEYDAANRLVRTTYPDGTTKELSWDRLDLATETDRNGLTTQYGYDAQRNRTSATNPRGETVSYGYQENGLLVSLTDAKGNVTRWERDIQGRVTAKVFPGGARETQTYDSAGRQLEFTDGRGFRRRYAYGADDRLTSMMFPGQEDANPTIRFVDETAYPRVATITDESVGTTRWTYVPAGSPGAGQLASEDGPYQNDVVSYSYDALGRPNQRSVGGQMESLAYDALGRLATHSNPLGSFQYSYLGQTSQITRQALAGGLAIDYAYGSNDQDRRLQAIEPHPGAPLHPRDAPRAWRYHTAPEAIILGIQANPGGPLGYHYDHAYRLIGVTHGLALGLDGENFLSEGTVGVPPQGNWRAYYRYDPAGNLTEATHPGGTWRGQPNADNQYETAQGAAWLYDGAGNLLDDGRRTYRWDAQSRLTTVQDKATGRRTLLGYDGLSRLQSLTEYATPATAPVETRYLWCGEQICQARNRQDTVTALYYPQGELQGGTPLYYSRDHLGSVMETTTASGQVQGRLTYGAYGEPEQAEGQLPVMRYAGMLHHPASGFYLTHYRAYDPGTARWLSRDPIGEQGGVNLYGYVGGNPVSLVDLLGLYGTIDFVQHYFFGGGQAIDLGAVGLLGAFKNSNSVVSTTNQFNNVLQARAWQEAKSVCQHCSASSTTTSFGFNDKSTTDVTNEPSLYAVGHSTLFRKAQCAVTVNCVNRTYSYSCAENFSIRDKFSDPFRFRETFGKGVDFVGTPYSIDANFGGSVSGSGGF